MGEFLKVVIRLTLLVMDLVLYLCVMFISNVMYIFGVFSTTAITWGCDCGVSAFIFPIFFFGYFHFLGLTAEFLLG